MKVYLFLVGFCLLCGEGKGLAETMYVTDRLYLALRIAPDPEQPATALLLSDTKVEVLETEREWAEVKLEDGRSGWVMKRFLVRDLPKSLVIEELKREIEEKNIILQRSREKDGVLKKETLDRVMLEAKEDALKRKIETLKNQIIGQNKRLETTTREKTLERLNEIYFTGAVALLVGLIIGYLLGRPNKKRRLFSYHL